MKPKHYCKLCGLEDGACICASIPTPLKIVSDHGFPKGDGSMPDDDPFDLFKNERDYIAQSGRMKTTVAAMDWAAAEIKRLRDLSLEPPDSYRRIYEKMQRGKVSGHDRQERTRL